MGVTSTPHPLTSQLTAQPTMQPAPRSETSQTQVPLQVNPGSSPGVTSAMTVPASREGKERPQSPTRAPRRGAMALPTPTTSESSLALLYRKVTGDVSPALRKAAEAHARADGKAPAWTGSTGNLYSCLTDPELRDPFLAHCGKHWARNNAEYLQEVLAYEADPSPEAAKAIVSRFLDSGDLDLGEERQAITDTLAQGQAPRDLFAASKPVIGNMLVDPQQGGDSILKSFLKAQELL